LRMEVADTALVDEPALKHSGAAGVMKPGGTSVQVIYGTSVQFVKTAMDAIITGQAEPVTAPEIVEAGRADCPSAGTDTVLRTSHLVRLRQPIAGTVLELSAVPAPTFSGEVMGPGIAVEPEDGTVVDPKQGTVKHLSDTGHAVALERADGTERQINDGVDKRAKNGGEYTWLVECSQDVSAGTPLLRGDVSAIRRARHSTTTPIVVM